MTKKSTSICDGNNGGNGEKTSGKGVPTYCDSKQEDEGDMEKDDDTCAEEKVECSDSHTKFKKEMEKTDEAANECPEDEEETSSSEYDESKDECIEKDEKETGEKECAETKDEEECEEDGSTKDVEECEEDRQATDEMATSKLCDCTSAALLAKGVDKGKEAVMKKVCGKESQEVSGPSQKSDKAASKKPKLNENVQCCQVERAASKHSEEEAGKSNLAKCKEKAKQQRKDKGEAVSSSDKTYSGPEETKKIEEQCGCIRKALEKCNGPKTSTSAKPSKPPDKKKEGGNPEKVPKPDESEKDNDKEKDKKPDPPKDTKICNATRVGRKKRPVTKVCK